MRLSEQQLKDGERMPRWYRMAYFSWSDRCYIVAPIGIHLLVRIKRRLWEWSFIYRPSRLEVQMRAAVHTGYKAGYEDALKEIDKQINEHRSSSCRSGH